MADSKKYDGSQWEHSLRKQTTASEIIIPPTTIYTDGTAITNYTIKGNTVQDGTPTPSNPVMPNGVGERTENVYDKTNIITLTIGNRYGTYIPADTYSIYNDTDNKVFWFIQNGGAIFEACQPHSTSTVTLSGDTTGFYMAYNSASLGDVTIVEGSTVPTSYIPYGYKTPISSGGVTTPIYLSQQLYKIGDTTDNVISSGTATYNVAMYEFKGNENITKVNSSATNYLYYVVLTDTVIGGAMCSHLQYLSSGVADNIGFSQNQTYPNTFYFNLGADIMNAQTSGNTAEGFKEWLTAQYAAGTPLTLYRCTAIPTTETVTAPSIPTTEGANSITVDTTVQPSEFTATWTGWHDSSVKEYDGSDWQ